MVDPFGAGVRGNEILVARYTGDRLIIPAAPRSSWSALTPPWDGRFVVRWRTTTEIIEGLVNYKMRTEGAGHIGERSGSSIFLRQPDVGGGRFG